MKDVFHSMTAPKESREKQNQKVQGKVLRIRRSLKER